MDTARLSLPLLAPSQAQKHVTVNEALGRLDRLVHLAVESIVTEPPSEPGPERMWIVAPVATGAFSGQDNSVAYFDGQWTFIPPRPGWRAFIAASGQVLLYSSTGWRPLLSNIDQLGVGGVPDETNRLVVSAPASLFTHAGTDHRIICNKAETADVASLLFQDAYAGCAEVGLVGDDDLTLRVSADGASWSDALKVDRHTGIVRMPVRPAFYGRATNIDRSYGVGEKIEWSEGLDTASFYQASNRTLQVPVSGVYYVTLTAFSRDLSDVGYNYLGIYANGTSITSTIAPGTLPVTTTAQMELQAGSSIDVRSLYGTGARYWAETTLNVSFSG